MNCGPFISASWGKCTPTRKDWTISHLKIAPCTPHPIQKIKLALSFIQRKHIFWKHQNFQVLNRGKSLVFPVINKPFPFVNSKAKILTSTLAVFYFSSFSLICNKTTKCLSLSFSLSLILHGLANKSVLLLGPIKLTLCFFFFLMSL